MKVLHLIDSAGFYGAEVVLLNLIFEQKKQGIKVILGSIGKPGIKKKIEIVAEQQSINIKNFRFMNGPNIFGAITIIQFAKQKHIDLIHCHGYKGNILMGMLPSRYRKVPYLITFHGWTAVKIFSKMWFYSWADSLFAKRADMTVAVSSPMLDHRLIKMVRLKPVVVHNGIPLKKLIQKPSNQTDHLLNKLCHKGFTVGGIGRLSIEKGFDFLIRAVANVIKQGYDISLVIIGEGEKKQELEKLAKEKGIAEKLLFTGYLDKASQYINLFDVFIVSSLTEGLPITLLEAMQAGVPIIATRVGGIPEVLDNGKCGILVNPKNEYKLSEAIIKLYDSPELKNKLCLYAKKRVKEKFSSENMEQGYRKLYEKLLHT